MFAQALAQNKDQSTFNSQAISKADFKEQNTTQDSSIVKESTALFKTSTDNKKETLSQHYKITSDTTKQIIAK